MLRDCTKAIFYAMYQSKFVCVDSEACAKWCNALVAVQARLAKEAREHAITALELEPGSDLAHHLMGRQGC